MLFVNINRLKKSIPIFNNQNVIFGFFVDRKSRSALMELHTWNELDLGFM